MSLLILGGGTLELDITGQKATMNRYPVEPIPYAETARIWLNEQMAKHNIPLGELIRASLIIDYTVRQEQKPDFPFPSAHFEFTCTGTIEASDRTYTAQLKENKTWGLSTYF